MKDKTTIVVITRADCNGRVVFPPSLKSSNSQLNDCQNQVHVPQSWICREVFISRENVDACQGVDWEDESYPALNLFWNHEVGSAYWNGTRCRPRFVILLISRPHFETEKNLKLCQAGKFWYASKSVLINGTYECTFQKKRYEIMQFIDHRGEKHSKQKQKKLWKSPLGDTHHSSHVISIRNKCSHYEVRVLWRWGKIQDFRAHGLYHCNSVDMNINRVLVRIIRATVGATNGQKHRWFLALCLLLCGPL